MGCDIHVYTEKRNDKDHWVNVDLWRLNEYYNPYDPEYAYSGSQLIINSCYTGRDYTLFSALADVRSGSDDTPVFSQPRGLPDDVSDIVRFESDRYGVDGHSHSYATLAELEDWVNQQGTQHITAWVSAADAELLRTQGQIPSAAFRSRPSAMAFSENSQWVQASWEESFNALDNFLHQVSAAARDVFWVWGDRQLSDEQKQAFRVVFWFDN
jgi:hypothetical protein